MPLLLARTASPSLAASLVPRRSRDCKSHHIDRLFCFQQSLTIPSEDGTIVEEPPRKLGPKANQGAINAGLRALDRSGKPCRKWTRGTFQMKSFTGVVWEIPRWTAPPRPKPETAAPDAAAATATVNGNGATPASAATDNNSNKENNNPETAAAKVEDASSQMAVKSEMSTGGGDIEMQSAAPSIAPSPAPVPIAAA